MSTGQAISIMANTQAANANAAAQDALRRSCEASVKGYEHNSATVAQMLDYSKCIELLHHVDDSAVLVVKLCIICVIVGGIAGCIYGKVKNDYFGPFYYGAHGLFIGAGVWLLGISVAFLFS